MERKINSLLNENIVFFEEKIAPYKRIAYGGIPVALIFTLGLALTFSLAFIISNKLLHGTIYFYLYWSVSIIFILLLIKSVCTMMCISDEVYKIAINYNKEK